jgi:transcriptional regulator with XRE-family HTH domain
MPQLDDETRQKIGRYVRGRRLALGLTIKEATERSDLSDTKWIQVENGSTNHQAVTLSKVARGLGEDPKHLFEIAGLPAPQELIVEGDPRDALSLSAHSGELHQMSRDELEQLRAQINDLLGEGP